MQSAMLTWTRSFRAHNAGDSVAVKLICELTSKEPMVRGTQPPVVNSLTGHQSITGI